MKTIRYFFLFLFIIILAALPATSANPGDFQTKASGNWNWISVWQYYNGSAWVNATYTPTYTDGQVDILAAHTVTLSANVTIDQTDVHGLLVIPGGIILTINDGSSTDLSIYNTVTVWGTVVNGGTISGIATEFVFKNGALYRHNRNGGSLPDATWDAGSTCEVTGVTSSTSITNSDQTFYHFRWNCPGQTAETNCAGNLQTVNGNFYMVSTGTGKLKLGESADYTLSIKGNYEQTNGTLLMGGGSSNGYLNLEGNFIMSGGKITELNSSGYLTKISFTGSAVQTYSRTGGVFENNIDFDIPSGKTLDMGDYIVDGSLGQFSVSSGGTLRTANINGIANAGASGCIQTLNRYYSIAANFHYNRNGPQNTGNGLPSPHNGRLMIGSAAAATNLTLTNGTVTENGFLVLCSSNLANSTIVTGTIVYGSAATLEYQGMSAQTTTIKEWPGFSGPSNITVNNPYGVSLENGRTINGTLTLTTGNLSIGVHTLSLNGSLVKTSGGLTGGNTSTITIGGTSMVAIDLPGITLLDLFLNRPGGTRLIGDVTIYGSMAMTNGQVTLAPSKSLSYASGAYLKYLGTGTQNTLAEEFPATSGPTCLYVDKPAGVWLNLMFPRTLEGNLYLIGGNFSIGSNLLTLNGGIDKTDGFLVGGTSSSITFGGSGPATGLPGIDLSNLTVNRAAGIDLAGPVSVSGILSLAQGQLRIGSQSLTIGGTIAQTGGGLEGGSAAVLTFGPCGSTTGLPSVVLQDLVINRTPGITLWGNVTVENMLTLTSGTLSIGSNVLSISGQIQYSSGNLAGGGTSEMIISGPGPTVALSGLTLKNLIVNRPNGVMVISDGITIQNDLMLTSGVLSFNNYFLALNGTLTYAGGDLSGGTAASMIIGGTGSSISLQPLVLDALTLNRSAGMNLLGPVTVSGAFFLTNGTVNRNGNTLYGATAMLWYNGTIHQVTSDGEFPDTNGPYGVYADNPAGVELHDDRTINGTLGLRSGLFVIGPHTLTLNGNLFTGMGSFQGGSASNLVLGDNASKLLLSSVYLNNLIVNRSGGVGLTGAVTIAGTLNLVTGIFNVNNQTLTLAGFPIAGNLSNFKTSPMSGLQFQGSAAGVEIPSSVLELGMLMIGNQSPDGVTLTGNMNIASNVFVMNSFNLKDYTLTGPGIFNLFPGAKLMCGHPDGIQGNLQFSGPVHLDGGADYEFSGSSGQFTNFLPTMPADMIRNLIISNQDPSGVVLNNDMTVTGSLEILPGARFTIDAMHQLVVEGDVGVN